MSKLYGLIGFPVKHSYSAAMHNAAFQELGVDARYELFEVRPQNLEEEFNRLLDEGVAGLNVTIPYKERIIQSLDSLDQEAVLIGAVNTVMVGPDKNTKGFNTDGLGFITHLREVLGINPQGKTASILGAGGAARAVGAQLAKSGAAGIYLFDLNQYKTKELAAKLRRNFSRCQVRQVTDANSLLTPGPDLLINATPVGMHGEESVFDATLLHPKLIVYDLIYNPARTALLREARSKGCAGVFNGLGMLLYQGVSAFKIWLGVEPPVKVMEQALREILTKV